MSPPAVVRTFALLDIAGFTALTESHGDDRAGDLAMRFVEVTVSHLADGDRLIKTMGDAVLVASVTPTAGILLVKRIVESCYQISDFPVVRGGLHHGPAVERGSDMFGSAINLTARLAAQASGEQILATGLVARVAREIGLESQPLGKFSLRNVQEPVELWELRLHDAPADRKIDPVCRMNLARDRAAGTLVFDDTEYWFCSVDCIGRFASAPEAFTS